VRRLIAAFMGEVDRAQCGWCLRGEGITRQKAGLPPTALRAGRASRARRGGAMGWRIGGGGNEAEGQDERGDVMAETEGSPLRALVVVCGRSQESVAA